MRIPECRDRILRALRKAQVCATKGEIWYFEEQEKKNTHRYAPIGMRPGNYSVQEFCAAIVRSLLKLFPPRRLRTICETPWGIRAFVLSREGATETSSYIHPDDRSISRSRLFPNCGLAVNLQERTCVRASDSRK